MWLLCRVQLSMQVLTLHCIAQSIDIDTCSLAKVANCKEFRNKFVSVHMGWPSSVILLNADHLDHFKCYLFVVNYFHFKKAKLECEKSGGMLPWYTNTTLESIHMKEIISQVLRINAGDAVNLWLGFIGYNMPLAMQGWYWKCPNDSLSVKVDYEDIAWKYGAPYYDIAQMQIDEIAAIIYEQAEDGQPSTLIVKLHQFDIPNGLQFICVAPSASEWPTTSSSTSLSTTYRNTYPTSNPTNQASRTDVITLFIIILICLLSLMIIGLLVGFEIKRRNDRSEPPIYTHKRYQASWSETSDSTTRSSATANLEPKAFSEELFPDGSEGFGPDEPSVTLK